MVKPSSSVPYCFVSGLTDRTNIASPSKYVLTIRQQPNRAKVCGMKERDRRPIDPPPIIQIKLADPSADKNKDYLQSPYLFMCCNLVQADDPSGKVVAPAHRALAGTVVSSLNRLKDVDNTDGGFFVFGDVSVRTEGYFRLRLTLFELIEGEAVHVMTTVSSPFTAYPSRTFPGMSEPTFLSRSFSDQGVRIRIRKDHHVKPKKSLAADGSMHSPPSSCHEAEHSDNDMEGVQPTTKRSRASAPCEDTAHSGTGYPGGGAKHIAIAARPKYTEAVHPFQEPMHRTPPSSPNAHLGQDAVPSRPHHDPYIFEDSSSGHYQHFASRPSHYDSQSSYRHDHASSHYPSSYHTGHPRHHQGSYPPEHHRPSSSGPSHGHPSYEHGYSSSPHPPSSSVHNPGPFPPMHAGRHGFPAELLNHPETEYSHGHPSQPYHSRTPSMSSQHSDGNGSPPLPFSPPEPQLHYANQDRARQSSTSSNGTTLPSILTSLSKASISGEKIQLPPIHTLSTYSPPMRPAYPALNYLPGGP